MKRIDRKKQRMEQQQIFLFRIFLVIPTVLWIFVLVIGWMIPAFRKAVDYDLGENRNPAVFPESFSSSWFTDLEKYYNDRVPFRSLLICSNQKLSKVLETPYEKSLRPSLIALFHKNDKPGTDIADNEEPTTINWDDLFGNDDPIYTEPYTGSEDLPTIPIIIPGGDPFDGDDPEETEPELLPTEPVVVPTDPVVIPTEPVVVPTEPVVVPTQPVVVPTQPAPPDNSGIDTESYFPPVIKNSAVIIGRGDWLFLSGYKNLKYYLGNNLLTVDEMNQYLMLLSQVDNLCKAKGKQFAVLVVPSKEQVYSEYMPSYNLADSYKRAQRLVDYISANSTVKICYPLKEELALKANFQTYFRHDSHWNATGSFIGVQMMYKLIGIPTTNLLKLPVTTRPKDTGDLVTLGGLDPTAYQNDIDYAITYKPEVGYTDIIGSGKDPAKYIIRITSTSPNPQKIAVVGDSYRNATFDFLPKDFRVSTYIHTNLMKNHSGSTDTYLREADIITIIVTERNDTTLLTNCQSILEALAD